MANNESGSMQAGSYEKEFGFGKPVENTNNEDSSSRQENLRHFRNQEHPFAPGESIPSATAPSLPEKEEEIERVTKEAEKDTPSLPKNELDNLRPGQKGYIQKKLNEVEKRKSEDPLLKIRQQFLEEENKRQQREKEEIERVTKEAEKKAIHQKELDSNKEANKGFDSDKSFSRGGQDALAKQDEISRRIKAEEELSSLKEELAEMKGKMASLEENFIKLWKEKLGSYKLEDTQEEDLPEWVSKISEEPEEDTTKTTEDTEPEQGDDSVLITPPPKPEDTTPEEDNNSNGDTEQGDDSVLITPPPTPEDMDNTQEDENQEIEVVDGEITDITQVNQEEQGIVPANGIINVTLPENQDPQGQDPAEMERVERRNKRLALIAGVVAGGATGLIGGAAVVPTVGIGVVLAASVTSVSKFFVGRGIRNVENRLKDVTDPNEKANLERRLNSYRNINRRLGYVKSFFKGSAYGLLASSFISSTFLGGQPIFGAESMSGPDVTSTLPGGQETVIENPATGSIETPIIETPTEIADLPDISNGWLDTTEFGWDTSQFGWKGSRLFVPSGGVAPGGAPDLQTKFVEALFDQGISKTQLMGQEAGNLFNEGLINAAYKGGDINQVAQSTAQALKGLVK